MSDSGDGVTLVSVPRVAVLLLFSLRLFGQCRLPDVAPSALARLTPSELLDSGHYLRAARILEPMAAERPQDGQIAWLLSRAKAALGDLDGAMKLADTALASDANSAAYHVQVAAVAGRMAEKASLLKRLSLAGRAKKELDAALALDPNNTDAQWGLMMFYYAVPPLVGGDKAKARQIGEQMAAAAPDPGRYYQARLAMELKESDKAEAYLKQAVIENPLQFDTAAALAKFYIETKPDQLRAERWACQALHADPGRAGGWALLARVYTMCGCWTEAADIADRAEAIDPENLAPWYAIAAAAVEREEQLGVATALLRKYMSKPVEGNEPSLALAHLELGLALEKLGKAPDALPELRTALEQDSSLEAARVALKRVTSEARR